MKILFRTLVLFLISGITITFHTTEINAQTLPGFETNFEKRSIDLNELIDGGPGKDGIPSIDDPKFVSQEEASSWLNG